MRTVKSNRQRGVTTLEFVIWGTLAAVAMAIMVSVLLGRQSEANLSRAKTMISSDIGAVLASLYQARGYTYASLSADAAGKSLITARGISPAMPWGADSWSISTAGTGSTVILTFPTSNTRRPAELAADLASGLLATGGMVRATSATATSVVVTFGEP